MSAVPSLPSDVLENGIGPDKSAPTTTNASDSGFTLHDTPIENQRPLKAIVIGAGYSGIYLAIRLPEKLRNVELVVYEKNKGVGGTWWENRYLGCACDIPSHSYQYSFSPNHSWSSLYAPAREIQAYLENTAKKYSADRFIKLQHEITAARWDDAKAKWFVQVKDLVSGESKEESCDILISARGNLNTPRWPDIKGLDGFREAGGEVMHSAGWNQNYDFANKKVALLGTGSSAIQILPSLARLPGTHIANFARSRTWISPSFGQALWDKHGFEGSQIPAEIRDKFLSDPEFYSKFRQEVEEDGNAAHGVTIHGTPMQIAAKEAFTEHMKERLMTIPDVFDKLVPAFSPGCRRLTPGPGYLEALTQSNVKYVTDEISHISPEGVHTRPQNGEKPVLHKADVLICATGFQSSVAPPFPVTGLHGLPLSEHWEDRPSTYLSHSIAGFPNFFLMLGPNSAIGAGSLTAMIESVGDYIVKCVRKVQKENIARLVVKQSRVEDFCEYSDAYFEGTVFSEACASWYKSKAGGKQIVTGIWPGSTLHCKEVLRSPRWEDYTYKYVGEDEDSDGEQQVAKKGKKGRRVNRLAWLGNGWTINETEARDLAWYLYPQFVEENKPVAPRPEENEGFKARAFSY